MPVVNKPNIIIKFIIETSLIFLFDFNKLYNTTIEGIRRKTTYLIFWEVEKKLVSIVWSIPLSVNCDIGIKKNCSYTFSISMFKKYKIKKVIIKPITLPKNCEYKISLFCLKK